RAAAYEQLKKYSSAKIDCTKALELNPKYIKALLRRARVLEQTGDLESALKDMSTVCIYENFSDQASLLKAEMMLEKLVEQVDRNSSHKNFFMLTTHAIEIYYIKAFFKDPVLSRLEYPENIPEGAVITAYLAIQMLNKAKRDFEKAIECNPNFSAAHMQKWYTHYHFAVLNKDLNLAEMTVRDVEKAFDKYSNSPECICCYVLYAQIMCKAQQYQKADTYFIKAIKKNPDYAIIYLLLWNSNIDDIEKYLNKALKLETCSIGGKLRCIEILRTIEIQRGNMEEAIKLFEKALAFCRTFKEMLYIYSVHAVKIHLDRNNQFGHIIHFLLSYFRFNKQNVGEFDKHISVNSDEPPEVLSPAAESEVKKILYGIVLHSLRKYICP
ncbi:Mitochondrial import receptor subunit TOM70, partial [Cyphomyrmex costatus]